MSRAVLGGLVERSAEWVKAVETGRLHTPRLPMLLELAQALNITDLADLTGNDIAVPVESFTTTPHAALGAVRAALVDRHLSGSTAKIVDARHLAARLDQAWKIRHSTPDHRTAVGAILPALIRDAQQAVRQTSANPVERRAARKVLAGVYQLTDFYVAYQPAPELVWMVADRAIIEAQEADDPYLMAGGAWALTQALRDAGRWDEAVSVSEDAAQLLHRHIIAMPAVPDDWRGMWGALTFETGYVHARRGRHGSAWACWERADEVARTLGPRYRHIPSSFSQAVMHAHAVTLEVELRRSGDAVRRAVRFTATDIPSLARRSRHMIEVARAHHHRTDAHGTHAHLRAALVTAPETVRFNGYAKEMTQALLASPPTGLHADVRTLADQIGLAV